MTDLLRFIVSLAADGRRRDRFRRNARGVLEAEVDGAATLTGEDVEAAVAWARDRLRADDDPRADLLRAASPVRPLGVETPGDAAVRLLEELCEALEGPPAPVIPLAVTEPPPPPPGPIATGGGRPVPDAPPWLRGRRLWAIDGGRVGEDPDPHPE